MHTTPSPLHRIQRTRGALSPRNHHRAESDKGFQICCGGLQNTTYFAPLSVPLYILIKTLRKRKKSLTPFSLRTTTAFAHNHLHDRPPTADASLTVDTSLLGVTPLPVPLLRSTKFAGLGKVVRAGPGIDRKLSVPRPSARRYDASRVFAEPDRI